MEFALRGRGQCLSLWHSRLILGCAGDGDFAELGCVRACQGEARHSREEPQETFNFSFSGVVSIGTSVHQETIF